MKLLRIIKSRFKKKGSKTKWEKEREKICKSCPFNTKNKNKTSTRIKIIIWLSKLYDKITFNSATHLGYCGECGCDLEYKIPEIEEQCPKNKWNEINYTR